MLSAFEPRLFTSGEYIYEENDNVDEHLYVINRDVTYPINSTGQYCVGFSLDKETKYFHVKLGPKTIIGGYENLFGKPCEFTYRALGHMDAYGLRKIKVMPILKDDSELGK